MKPDLVRGDSVVVNEQNRVSWGGVVLSVKPRGKRGWAVEVRDTEDDMVWVLDPRWIEKADG